jgi:hypothetical protein
VHGLIFFYIQKFADVVSPGTSSWQMLRSQTSTGMANYLPSGVYPDAEAVQLIESIARSTGRPLPIILEEFGEFLAPHLIRVAGALVNPAWRTLDLIENTEAIIHAMIRTTNPGATPPVLEALLPGRRPDARPRQALWRRYLDRRAQLHAAGRSLLLIRRH